jgi:hypothetical protein
MPNSAVYQAIRRDYRSKQLDLSRSLERQSELSAQLAGVNDEIIRARTAIAELDSFAVAHGWTVESS